MNFPDSFPNDSNSPPERTNFSPERLQARLPAMQEVTPYASEEHRKLLTACLDLSIALNLPNEYIDIEGGEHYSYRAEPMVIDLLKQVLQKAELDELDGLEVFREERPEYAAGDLPTMTFTIRLSFNGLNKTYIFKIFTQGIPETHLSKYTEIQSEDNVNTSPRGIMLLNMMGGSELEDENDLNGINQEEYNLLTHLLKNLKELVVSS